MERISELLDEYGWASGGEKRRLALLRWMTEATNRIQEIQHRLDNPELAEDNMVLGYCPHGVNLDVAICPKGCRV